MGLVIFGAHWTVLGMPMRTFGAVMMVLGFVEYYVRRAKYRQMVAPSILLRRSPRAKGGDPSRLEFDVAFIRMFGDSAPISQRKRDQLFEEWLEDHSALGVTATAFCASMATALIQMGRRQDLLEP